MKTYKIVLILNSMAEQNDSPPSLEEMNIIMSSLLDKMNKLDNKDIDDDSWSKNKQRTFVLKYVIRTWTFLCFSFILLTFFSGLQIIKFTMNWDQSLEIFGSVIGGGLLSGFMNYYFDKTNKK